MSVNLSIAGIQDAQDENLKAIAALQPSGASQGILRNMVVGLHRYAVGVTHAVTGALRASHTMVVKQVRGEIFIAANQNPRSKAMTNEYGIIEHNRGGEHAFYDRTMDEAGPDILDQAYGALGKEVY